MLERERRRWDKILASFSVLSRETTTDATYHASEIYIRDIK